MKIVLYMIEMFPMYYPYTFFYSKLIGCDKIRMKVLGIDLPTVDINTDKNNLDGFYYLKFLLAISRISLHVYL